MAIVVTLNVTPTAPTAGQTVTATYTVTGNTPGPSSSATVEGSAIIGGIAYDVSTTLTVPGTPALPQSFTVPTATGLTFTSTSVANVFTAVA